MTLDQITKYLQDQDATIKALFKQGKSLAPDSPEKAELNKELDAAKAKLKAYLQKEQ